MKNYPQNIDVQKAEEAGIRFYSSSEDQELAYLKEALKRTDEEKFFFLMNLMKMGQVMSKAKFIDK
ncbi:MAG: hypothetical protein JWR72_1364 [Flavisolibacter sp.]|jgi:hypothetical protein|nr:hypothetical protein [Flavisolibacter sp.]